MVKSLPEWEECTESTDENDDVRLRGGGCPGETGREEFETTVIARL